MQAYCSVVKRKSNFASYTPSLTEFSIIKPANRYCGLLTIASRGFVYMHFPNIDKNDKKQQIRTLFSKELFGRKIRAKKGPMVANKAVAGKLAVLYWKLFVKELDNVEKGIKAFESAANKICIGKYSPT